MQNFNLQPYAPNGETTGRRTVKWFEENVWPQFSDYTKGKRKILDVGCGNGRLLPLLASKFEIVHCLDPVCSIHPKFSDIVHWKYDSMFHEFSPPFSFDVLLFFGSWNIMFNQYGENLLNLCRNVLILGGIVVYTREINQIHQYDNANFSLEREVVVDNTVVTILKRRA